MNRQEFIKKIYSKSYIDKIIKKVNLLGYSDNTDPYNFLISRLISLVLVFCICLYAFSYGYLIAPIATVIYYNLYNEIFLNNKIKKRNIILEKEAMHFFEVLTLSLETGRNLSEAIDVTTNSVEGILSLEFKESIREVSFGKSLSEALNDMQERIPSDTINNVILSLTQSNLYGNSIIENLYTQIDYLREKRKLEVKGRISKVPVLISVISVLFFVPLLLIIILGPVLLEFL
jgi:tight adherence protein C